MTTIPDLLTPYRSRCLDDPEDFTVVCEAIQSHLDEQDALRQLEREQRLEDLQVELTFLVDAAIRYGKTGLELDQMIIEARVGRVMKMCSTEEE